MITKERLPQIPSTRMNNFISDFLADSANQGKTRADAMQQWQALKQQGIPKTYADYQANRSLFEQPSS